MFRGTTPTFSFTLPFSCARITALNICFVQGGAIVLEKDLSATTSSGNILSVSLTEEETLQFEATKGVVEMQLRVGCGEARMASNIMQVPVERILKDGCLV